MELRASFLMGTDVVALCLWPTDPAGALAPRTLPVEARCVDQSTAEIVENLVRQHAAGPGPVTHPAEWVLHTLVDRVERDHPESPDAATT